MICQTLTEKKNMEKEEELEPLKPLKTTKQRVGAAEELRVWQGMICKTLTEKTKNMEKQKQLEPLKPLKIIFFLKKKKKKKKKQKKKPGAAEELSFFRSSLQSTWARSARLRAPGAWKNCCHLRRFERRAEPLGDFSPKKARGNGGGGGGGGESREDKL